MTDINVTFREPSLGGQPAPDMIIGGIRAVGPVEHCLFFNVQAPDDGQPIVLGNARGLAICPIDRIADMAANHVSVWDLVRAKLAFWRRGGRGPTTTFGAMGGFGRR